MQFSQNEEPEIKKPIIIAAMQDMGNVGTTISSRSSLQKTFRGIRC
mgnify:CR=1 FL=1